MYEKWCLVLDAVPQYEGKLDAELERQQANEALRVEFAEKANGVGAYIDERSAALSELSMDGKGTMEEQLEAVKAFQADTLTYQPQLDDTEAVNQALEAAIVFDNPHTQYNMDSLRSSWALLSAAINRALNETQNQILIRDSKGLSETQIGEYRQSFHHFDKVSRLSRTSLRVNIEWAAVTSLLHIRFCVASNFASSYSRGKRS